MAGRTTPHALIAGVHEFPERKTAKSALEIQALSARAALADAGLGPRDVDGFFTVAGSGATGVLPVVDYLSLNPRYVDGTTIGGASFVAHASHAAAAIAAGRCRVALVTYGSTARSQGVAIGTRARAGGDYVDQFEAVHGVSIAALYALVAQRHMHVYGTTGAELAAIAVACRRHAGLNPDALYRVELEDGVQVLTNLVDCDPDRVRIGTAVRVTFEDLSSEVTVPRFRPVAEEPS